MAILKQKPPHSRITFAIQYDENIPEVKERAEKELAYRCSDYIKNNSYYNLWVSLVK